MADYFRLDGLDDGEEVVSEGQVESRSQIAVFLVSAPCAYKSEEVFEQVRDILVDRVLDLGLSGVHNRAAVIFYGTTEKRDTASGFGQEHIYSFSTIETPTISMVQDLASLTLSEMKGYTGEALQSGTDDMCDVLRRLLNMTQGEVTSASKGPAKSAARKTPVTVVFLTADPDPFAGRSKLREQFLGAASSLQKDAFVMVVPITERPNAFPRDADAFWNRVQRLHDSESSSGKSLAGVCVGNAADDIVARWPVTKAIYHRRAFLALAPGAAFPVLMYHLVKPPSARPSKWLHGDTNEELVSKSALECCDTGTPLLADDLELRYVKIDDKNAEANGLPDKVVMLKEQLDSLRVGGGFGDRHPSLTLVCFKPRSALTIRHQIDLTAHIALDDHQADKDVFQRGALAFCSLWLALKDRGQVAVCTFVASVRAAPRLVALDVVEEETENGKQVTPPGFAMHLLPYANELRDVQHDPKILSEAGRAPRPTPEQVAAATALVDCMSDRAVTRFTFGNTAAEFADAVVRAQILGCEAPTADAFPDSATAYLERCVSRVPPAVRDGFLNTVLGGSMHDSEASKKKRGATQTINAADVVVHIDWKQLAQSGTLSKKTNDVLKAYLKHHKLSTTGVKADLVKRVEEHALKSG